MGSLTCVSPGSLPDVGYVACSSGSHWITSQAPCDAVLSIPKKVFILGPDKLPRGRVQPHQENQGFLSSYMETFCFILVTFMPKKKK